MASLIRDRRGAGFLRGCVVKEVPDRLQGRIYESSSTAHRVPGVVRSGKDSHLIGGRSVQRLVGLGVDKRGVHRHISKSTSSPVFFSCRVGKGREREHRGRPRRLLHQNRTLKGRTSKRSSEIAKDCPFLAQCYVAAAGGCPCYGQADGGSVRREWVDRSLFTGSSPFDLDFIVVPAASLEGCR